MQTYAGKLRRVGPAGATLRVFTKYALAGLAGTAVHYLVMWHLLATHSPVAATTFGALAGGAVNFCLARRFVFATNARSLGELIRFTSVALFAVLTNAGVVFVLAPVLPLAPCQILATGIAFIQGFVLNKYWTFHE